MFRLHNIALYNNKDNFRSLKILKNTFDDALWSEKSEPLPEVLSFLKGYELWEFWPPLRT